MQPADRPQVMLSAAMSADGYIDDATSHRLVLSDAADLERVDELRAGSDAIMVGAQTIRADNPRLLVRSAARRARRCELGLPASPRKVTITGTGSLDPRSRFFTDTGLGGAGASRGQLTDPGNAPLVYAPAEVAADLAGRLPATVVAVPLAAGRESTGFKRLDLPWVLADLAARGIARLMVEGGSSVLGQFLAAGLADELWLAIAPVVVADPAGPRLVSGGPVAAQLELAEVAQVGGMAVLRYLLARRPAA